MRAGVAVPCVGKWQLFDSNKPGDHERALNLCVACPLLAECGQWARETRAELGSYAALTGTWGGRLYGATDKGGRRRTTPPECGTLTGRRAHYDRGETPCEPCRSAFNAWQKGYHARRRGNAA